MTSSSPNQCHTISLQLDDGGKLPFGTSQVVSGHDCLSNPENTLFGMDVMVRNLFGLLKKYGVFSAWFE